MGGNAIDHTVPLTGAYTKYISPAYEYDAYHASE